MTENKDTDTGRSTAYRAAYFNTLTHYLDTHVNAVRNISTVLAIAGFAFAARGVRLFNKFYSVSDIPPQFIQKNVRLQGKVVHVKDQHLQVEHIPILYLRIPFLMKKREGSIGVHLAGVKFEEGGVDWLKENVHTKGVFFTMLQVNSRQQLDCVVTARRPGWRGLFSSMCLNEELVRQGLGKVAPIEGMQVGTTYVKLTKKLLRAELVAERKRRGVWTEPTVFERYKARYDNAKEDMMMAVQRRKKAVVEAGRILASPASLLKSLWTFASKKFRRE
ncbi:C3orf33 [Branchiostoma lanceolatum]|uniref:C3orf33 protein n=1 Tax=Branchiostoma lanceolatum TaxID=7740 RepID=A0A8J9ZM65_BRALA|nr:C3orf33 [Branchiostoma lanceolatum]